RQRLEAFQVIGQVPRHGAVAADGAVAVERGDEGDHAAPIVAAKRSHPPDAAHRPPSVGRGYKKRCRDRLRSADDKRSGERDAFPPPSEGGGTEGGGGRQALRFIPPPAP